MGQENYIIKERNIIEFLWEKKDKKKRVWSECRIAALLGVQRSMISREIRRGYYVQMTSSLEQVPAYSACLA
jgi:IS30 family transposase